jgi:hypothetical protein
LSELKEEERTFSTLGTSSKSRVFGEGGAVKARSLLPGPELADSDWSFEK